MTLYQLAGAYVVALAIEGLAIEAECSDAREKAIELAFRIAVETGKREEFNRGIRDPMVAIIVRILDKQAIRRKHEGCASEL